MCRVVYFVLFLVCFQKVSASLTPENDVDDSPNLPQVPVDTLVNLTGHNELWTLLLKDCEKPSLTCVENNVYKYFKKTLDETNDVEFTNYLKFSKNHLNYDKYKIISNSSDDLEDPEYHEHDSPIESMSRSLHDDATRFLMTHDMELSLPDTLFPNSVLRISPQGYKDRGALVNLQVVSRDFPEDEVAGVEEGRTIKKIRKWRVEFERQVARWSVDMTRKKVELLLLMVKALGDW